MDPVLNPSSLGALPQTSWAQPVPTQMLLGQGPVHPGDLNVPVNSLTGDLDALKNQVFVLKEGIEYKVKITFKVRVMAVEASHVPAF